MHIKHPFIIRFACSAAFASIGFTIDYVRLDHLVLSENYSFNKIGRLFRERYRAISARIAYRYLTTTDRTTPLVVFIASFLSGRLHCSVRFK